MFRKNTMKKYVIIAIITMTLLIFGFLGLNMFYQNFEKSYQQDADILRLEHLEFWTELVNEYHNKMGHYPFQDSLKKEDDIVLVRIATQNQQQYFSKDSDLYRPDLDYNYDNFFREVSVKDFVSEIEDKLERNIDEKYDIQKVPTNSVIWYNYFVSKKGYLVWIPCITCGVSKISTLTMDGRTPTVNIVSEGMLDDVPKSLTREDMISSPIYKNWKSRGMKKEGYLRELEKENFDNSK